MIASTTTAPLTRLLVFLMFVGLLTDAFTTNPRPFHRVSSITTPPSLRESYTRLFFGLNEIEKQEEHYLELAAANTFPNIPNDQPVYIVVYSPHTEEETVHATEYPRGSENYCLLVFQSEVECQDFADTLTVGQPGSVEPEPTQYTLEQMDQYCQEMNWPLMLVPDEASDTTEANY